ncbi:extracellular solute-binding protein [Diaminobutyricibacter tongyongensis]|uniref:Extracellular solute-binding protein n=1 Tax=Leifsonia tongyongensis TaxID=1268043 RepID=A0A6L9Y220_9MICO|nr:extracellular solute-binding protein [Diaminobutyricibacter tongyongensis]NEN07693.1 extracellular solute-binding protein [Diaminobutyricibacter tongyongensis]
MPRTIRPARSTTSRRRLLKAGAIAIAVAAALAACTSSGTAGSTTGAPTGTLSYWYAPNTPDAKGVANFIKYNITPYQKKYPKVDLQAVQKNVNTINQQIQVALAAGKGPDIVTASGISNQITYAKAGYLSDLSSFATANKWSDTLLPWASEVSKVDGKTVTLPQGYETLLLFYNKTLFQKNGWTPPTNQQEVEDLAAKMEAQGITPFAAGNSDYPAGTEWLVSAFFNDVAGAAKVHDALTGSANWTDPAFADSINRLKSYFDKGWFGGGVKKYFSTTDPQKYTQFASGQAGMYISGSWEFVTLPDYFKKANSEFDWAPLPSLADGVPVTYPLSIGNVLSVNKNTKNAHAAELYLDWNLKDTKTMWDQVANTGSDAMPVKINPSEIPSNVDPKIAREYTELAKASEQGAVGYTTWTSWGGQADQYIVDNTDKVLAGSLSTTDYLNGLQAAYKGDVQKATLPTIYSTGKSLG